jgi:hypothetical protein
MIVSILTRNTRIKEREVWEAALTTVMPRIREVLEGEPGYASVEYFWGLGDAGCIAQMTKWENEESCQNYIRNGAAATVATIEEAVVPTAPYPNGAWVRTNFAAVES